MYALGVVLYFALTGDFPVRPGSAVEVLEGRRSGEVVRLRSRGRFPGRLVQVIETALHTDPNRRYQSAGALAAALRSLAPKRWPWWVATSAAAGALIAGFVVWQPPEKEMVPAAGSTECRGKRERCDLAKRRMGRL